MYYDKRIRYISYYESGIKLQNAGYVKFQVRDSLCQMIIYMKGPRMMGSGEAKVYLLSENQEKKEEDGFYSGGRKNNLRKHILGNLNIRNGQGYCAVRLDAENMAGSGLRYDEICGMKIELNEFRYLESQWTVTNFMPAPRQEKGNAGAGFKLNQTQNRTVNGNIQDRSRWNNKQGEGLYSGSEEKPVEVSLIVTPVSENLKVEKLVRETPESAEAEDITVEMFREEKKEESDKREMPAEVSMPVAEKIMPVVEELREIKEEEVEELTEATVEAAQDERMDGDTGRAFSEEESMQELLEREVRKEREAEEIPLAERELQPDKWEQLKKNYPIVHPIREEEEYLKISPRDFVIFTEKYQELVHNSFLLHGYYNYKHLILGKKERDGKIVYYLGVPGTFHEREKTVAVMFGFEAFDGKREPAENGDFGYYLRRVEI